MTYPSRDPRDDEITAQNRHRLMVAIHSTPPPLEGRVHDALHEDSGRLAAHCDSLSFRHGASEVQGSDLAIVDDLFT